ncbi:MAG: PKD domain-containing protein [Thermodesulfovibrionales bacterium]
MCILILSNVNSRTASAAGCDCVSCHGANHHSDIAGNNWAGCQTSCHLSPPATGAHLSHSAALSNTTYGDTVASTAGEYRFGCGHCHALSVTTVSNHAATRSARIELNSPAATGQTGAQICADCHNAGPHASCDAGDCLSCHSVAIGSLRAVVQGTNHHSGGCATCHDTGSPDGRVPHDQIVPLATNASCAVCHAESIASMNHSKMSGAPANCVTCHNYSGVGLIPYVNTACGQCHGGSGPAAPGLPPFTVPQLSILATNIHNTIPRTASFTWSPGAADNQVNVDASASACTNAPCTYSWNFGDGATGTGVTSSRTYAAAGSYLVVVKVTDSTGAVTMSPTGSVSAASLNTPPVAARSITQSGWTVNVIDASTDTAALPAGAVFVDWGNGTTSTGNAGATISKTYSVAGTYIIKHKVTDAGGLMTWSSNVSVTVPIKYSVSGKVTMLNGTTPVASASARLMSGSTVVKMATTAADGTYTITDTAPGSYTVMAVKSGLTFSSTPAVVVTNTNVTGINIKATR